MTTLKIKETAVLNNIREIRTRTDSRIMAVVKENGYGLGLANIYNILKKAHINFFGVASTEEALELRSLGCQEDILLLTPELSVSQCCSLLVQDIIFMLGSYEQADILKEASARTKIIPRIHLAIDTGLGRYGFHWDALEKVRLCTSGMNIEGCYTHFATASSNCGKIIQKQFRRFEAALETLSNMRINYGMTHVCASKAFLKFGDFGCDAVRVGSLLLGCCPDAQKEGFERAVWLETPIYMRTFHKKGEQIGYDGRQRLRRDTLVGVVKAGYSDGIFLGGRDGEPSVVMQFARKCCRWIRRQGRGQYVEIDGSKVLVLGKIGVGHLLLDLTDGDYLIGDVVRININPIFVPKQINRCLEPAGVLQTEENTGAAAQESNRQWLVIANRAGICLNGISSAKQV